MVPVFGILLLLCSYCHGHTRVVCPRAESSNSGIKSGPCSSDNVVFEDDYTDITPGPLTIQFEETIVHTGAPTFITLNKWGEKNRTCMLLDHIPHNEAARMELGEDCWITGYPMGRCPAQHYVTVNIPDIECDNCYIQVISVMLDKYDVEKEGPCVQFDNGHNNCSTYYSCSMVKIRPTSQGKGKGMDSCTNYADNVRGTWPYRPRDLYNVDLSGDSSESVSQIEFDAHGNFLSFTLPESLASLTLQAKIYHGTDNVVVYEEEISNGVGKWMGLSHENRLHLLAGQLVLQLTDSSSNSMAEGNIILQKRVNEADVYVDLGIDFTEEGWLQGSDFIGVDAPYSFAVQPYGTCLPQTRYFVSKVTEDGESDKLGALSLTISENRGWIRASVSGLTGNINKIELTDTTGTVPSFEVPVSAVRNNQVNAVLDMQQQITFLRDSKVFLNQATITTDSGESLVGAIGVGQSAALLDDCEYMGEAVLVPQSHGNFEYAIAFSGVDGVTDVSFNGPARNLMNGPVLQSVFSNYNSAGFATGTWQGLNADVLHLLDTGLVYVDVQTPETVNQDRGISGQISLTDEDICQNNQNRCFSNKLTLNGTTEDRGLEEVATNGIATVIVTNAGVLEYSISLRDMKPGESVTDLEFVYGSSNTVSIRRQNFVPSDLEDKVQLSQGSITDPAQGLLDALAQGQVTLRINTSRYSEETVEGKLPAITQRP